MGNLPVSEMLQRVRSARSWSQTEMAFHLKVGASAVGHYESGRRVPEPVVLRRYAELAPAELGEKLRGLLPADLRATSGAVVIPDDLRAEISRVAKNKNIDKGTALRQIIRAGLAQLTPSAEAGIGPSINPEESTAEVRRRRLALQEARSGKPRQPSRRKKSA